MMEFGLEIWRMIMKMSVTKKYYACFDLEWLITAKNIGQNDPTVGGDWI
jgi:hypothetical protein